MRGYTDIQIAALIADGYKPVMWPSDLDAIRNSYVDGTKRIFAQGTKYDTGLINTIGQDDKYVQVSDIDLYQMTRSGGQYYNSGAGWNPIGGQFGGIYDGGGYRIYGMYILWDSVVQGQTAYIGLFRALKGGGIVKNTAVTNFNFNSDTFYAGGIVGTVTEGTSYITDCIAHGTINHTGDSWAGGILGARLVAYTCFVEIERCVSIVNINSTGTLNGGISGQISEAQSKVIDCISLGRVTGTANVGGLVGYAEHDPVIQDSYYNSDVTPDADIITGAKTIAELSISAPSIKTYYTWGSTWNFASGKYPTPSVYKDIYETVLPITDIKSSIDASDDIVLSWTAPVKTPIGYDIYIDNTKVNESIITGTSYTYTPTDSGVFTFYARAIYLKNGLIDSPCSNFIDDAYYLPNLVSVTGNEVTIADGRDSANTNHHTIIGLPVAKEVGGVEYTIPLTDSTFTAGTVVGDYYGTGTIITREFSDLKRTINQTITVEARRIKIENTITYLDSVSVEYEGFALTGHVAYDRKRNVFGYGSGQHIINNTGIWFHNGDYTYHRVLVEPRVIYKGKNYILNDTENCLLCLMDGRDNVSARILLQPDGYNASLMVGNHADAAWMITQKAVMYGTSDTESTDFGAKGMVANGFLTDWSVFALEQNGVPAFENDIEYTNFLIELVNQGHEVIPHSISANEDDRTHAITFLPQYKDNFGSRNWIDHSLSAGAITLGINSKGWDVTDDENYMLDLFEENGFEQAWAYADFTLDRIENTNWGFPHQIAYYNDHLVMPSGQHVLLWWGSNRPFFYETLNLEQLINDCGSINGHEYFASSGRMADKDTASFKYTHYQSGDHYYITTGFENLLQDIAAKKASVEIWNPTVTEQNDYIIKLKDVEITAITSNGITINNSGGQIDGFSILVYKKNITPTVDGVAVDSKDCKLGTICWFDLPKGETVLSI